MRKWSLHAVTSNIDPSRVTGSPLADAVHEDQNARALGVAFNHDVAHYLVVLRLHRGRRCAARIAYAHARVTREHGSALAPVFVPEARVNFTQTRVSSFRRHRNSVLIAPGVY